jgi:hypothetical protein
MRCGVFCARQKHDFLVQTWIEHETLRVQICPRYSTCACLAKTLNRRATRVEHRLGFPRLSSAQDSPELCSGGPAAKGWMRIIFDLQLNRLGDLLPTQEGYELKRTVDSCRHACRRNAIPINNHALLYGNRAQRLKQWKKHPITSCPIAPKQSRCRPQERARANGDQVACHSTCFLKKLSTSSSSIKSCCPRPPAPQGRPDSVTPAE